MLTNHYQPTSKWHISSGFSLKSITNFILFFILLFSGTAFAQTVGDSHLSCDISKRNPCTSKDLSVVSVFIEGVDDCSFTCTPGQTVKRKLYMTIHNGTKSERTSFALYGTLSTGASINGKDGDIFVCVGPITIKSDEDRGDGPGNQTFLVGEIEYTCGDELTLTNNFLAWTDASGTTGERCTTFSNATKCSDIAPKCGTEENIVIRTPLTAAAATVTKPCENATTGGSISITPSGGLAPYDIVVSKKPTGDCPATAPSSSDANFITSWTDVSTAQTTSTVIGDYTCCIYVTDANGCKYNFSYAIEDKPCCVTPPKPTVCEVPQSNLCPETGGVTIKVSNLQANAYYIVKQTGETDKVQQAPSTVTSTTTLTFTGLVTGKGVTVYGEDRTSTPYCKSAEATCSDITVCAPEASSITNSQVQAVDMIPQARVMAAPNPFNDRIRFTLESDVAGQGTLELYNLQGQKVKTVYRGYVEKGQRQNIEYSVPVSQRSALIYLFRVGNQRTSGKLIGLKQ